METLEPISKLHWKTEFTSTRGEESCFLGYLSAYPFPGGVTVPSMEVKIHSWLVGGQCVKNGITRVLGLSELHPTQENLIP